MNNETYECDKDKNYREETLKKEFPKKGKSLDNIPEEFELEDGEWSIEDKEVHIHIKIVG